jgi:hypothetical protein
MAPVDHRAAGADGRGGGRRRGRTSYCRAPSIRPWAPSAEARAAASPIASGRPLTRSQLAATVSVPASNRGSTAAARSPTAPRRRHGEAADRPAR